MQTALAGSGGGWKGSRQGYWELSPLEDRGYPEAELPGTRRPPPESCVYLLSAKKLTKEARRLPASQGTYKKAPEAPETSLQRMQFCFSFFFLLSSLGIHNHLQFLCPPLSLLLG